jgi:phosphoglycolate phosphatase|tara:strand:+ start:134 stop:787 length:654 start_codon:yes stop_codon:yes gene_type:complete
MKYKHIIWDWNGTLLNDLTLCVDLLNLSLKKRRLPAMNEDDYRAKFLFPIKTFYESIGFDFSKETFTVANDEFHDGFEQNFKKLALQPFAVDAISHFKKIGIKQSILSATVQNKLTQQVEFFGITHLLDNVIGISNTPSGYGKEFEGKQLLKEINLPLDETIIIGDSMLDFNVAKALEIDCALLSNGHNNLARLKDTGSKTFSNIQSFSDWILDKTK